ncbi:acyl-CoA dehydrogenase family protein [Cellulomonas rhizosphaerae]|uniref:Acyl-CoA dehydrogenase n=1 Tax=Cellulomonas rhizosphaerae TaxID=2293719 RepID=A0A413RQ66_9CELL|nr:acyl-CoA dehydrogenase family protein [Cellulomonas rhizosphaerae]RHA44093.1 acyl-CoA dehydrogenase [Cellulomonas rhizosphaerae]
MTDDVLPVHIGEVEVDLPTLPTCVPDALRDVTSWDDDLRPGHGRTLRLWELLASLAARDLAVARAVEPHLDALAVLDQASSAVSRGGTWGVYAAEGPGAPLAARERDGGWTLDGVKPWCSLAGVLDSALVTAVVDDGSRALFAVDLRADEVTPVDQPWEARGLVEIPSTPVRFSAASATLVAGAEWYLARPGFWWGAIGVAACWFGGAVGIARRVHAEATRRPDDRLLAMHLGALDERLAAARVGLADAAARVDVSGAATRNGTEPEDDVSRQAGRILAKRVRATVARTCEDTLRIAGHALGPGPLTQEAAHAKRVADLEVYVRQQHAARDDASLGAVLAQGAAPW